MTYEELYRSNKRKYHASEQKIRTLNRRTDDYTSQRKKKQKQLENCKSQKKSREKRRTDVEKLIKMMEGSAGVFSTDVPGKIESAQKAVRKLDDSFHKSIKITKGGPKAADIGTVLRVKTVKQDTNSANALEEFKKVKKKLDGEISQLTKTIGSLQSSIKDLDNQIRKNKAAAAEEKRRKNNYYLNMNYYYRMWKAQGG